MEHLSMDFKRTVKSISGNHYLSIIIDYSQIMLFPFAFPCKAMTSLVATQSL